MNVRDMGLATIPRSAFTLGIILFSIPLGLLLAQVAPNQVNGPADSPLMSGLLAFTLVSCGAIPEELIFRGIIQPILIRHVGRLGIVIAALAFAATYLGSGSMQVVAVMSLAGIAYGSDAARTGSLWGPLVGHSLLAVSATIAGPGLGRPAI
jgi:membrane protease YdiL (CAAX protease family)